jgi:signal peptidase I
MAAVEQQKLELATMLLRSGGTIRIRAFGTSMLPTIWPGDIILIEGSACDRLARGDVVLIKREESIVVHRLINTDYPQWSTRGDAMPQNDPPVRPGDVLGRVREIHRGTRVIIANGQVRPHQRMLAWILCHSWLCRRAALRAHSVWRDRKVHQICEGLLQQGSSAN